MRLACFDGVSQARGNQEDAVLADEVKGVTAKGYTHSATGSSAVHATGENLQYVGIGGLDVLIKKCDDFFIAQGIALDYAVYAETEEIVKENFVNGLIATIGAHLRRYGDIEKLLKMAPPEVLKEFAVEAEENKLALLHTYRLPQNWGLLRFYREKPQDKEELAVAAR